MSSIAERLDRVERKQLKCQLRGTTESFVRSGKLVEHAMKAAYPTQDIAAQDYGVTPSLMRRQIDNADSQHLSFQRLWGMSDKFKQELLLVLAADLGVQVETTIRIQRRSA
jgi:hypothetical protein